MSKRSFRRVAIKSALAAFIAAGLPAVAGAQSEGRRFYELRQEPAATALVPLDLTGDLIGKRIVVELSTGGLREAKLHSALTEVLLFDQGRVRAPAAEPQPVAAGGSSENVTGTGTQEQPGVLAVTRVPEALRMPESTPRLNGEPIGSAAQPGVFHWLELGIDTTTVPVGRPIVVTVKVYDQGVALTGAPSIVRSHPAAVIVP